MSVYDSALYDSATYDGVGVGDPVVELFLNGVWVAVTSYARVSEGIQIRRGRQDWSSAPTFATCDLTLDNRDGRFTPRNTAGAYYPYLVRNTPLRVSVYKDDGTTTVRFWGDVAEFPVDVIASGADIVTRIQGCGLRRRLARSGVLQSPYRFAAGGLGSLVAYWPMEVGTVATGFGSAVTSGTNALTVSNTVNGGASSDFSNTSLDLPQLVGDQAGVQGFVPAYTLTAAGQQVRMLLECDTTTAGQGVDVVVAFTSGDYIVAEYIPVADTLEVAYRTSNGTTVATSGAVSLAASQHWATPSRISIQSVQSGADVLFTAKWYNTTIPAGVGGFSINTTAVATTLAAVRSVAVRNGGADVTTTVGHITVQNTITTQFDLAEVTRGYAGDTARDRAIRLASQNGVTLDANTDRFGITSELMGVQTVDTFLNLFDETAFVDGGISTETVDARSLTWRPRSAMYSNDSVLQIGYTLSRVMPGIQATDDDQVTENDVTVSRVNGGVANYMVTVGNLSVAAIGDYASSYDLNVFTDDQLPYQASWRANVGTIDAPRWPVVPFDALTNWTAATRTQIVAMREGDTLSLSNLPATTGASAVNQRVLLVGWTETITPTSWDFSLTCVPADVHGSVLILDSPVYGLLDTDRLAL